MYADLDDREIFILTSLANGETYLDIMTELDIKKGTMSEYRKRLFLKLGAKTAAHAVALGYHKGILLVPVRK